MSHADHERTQHVCLIIEFENLVYGLAGTEDAVQSIEISRLLQLAEEYGMVSARRAYADWRSRQVNQFQIDLYQAGVDLVHVLAGGYGDGNRRKNAVDVQMAVEAIELLWKFPDIMTFVIVTGDRDFIPVLKALCRYGKTIVAVAPAASASADLARLCDRFVYYESLAATFSVVSQATEAGAAEAADEGLDDVRAAMRRIFEIYGDQGIKGAMIKPYLRRELSATFDESKYGFLKMSQLLAAMPDTVAMVVNAAGGDLLVFPADATVEAVQAVSRSAEHPPSTLLRQADLSWYRFEQDRSKREGIIKQLFKAMSGRQVTWSEISDGVRESVGLTTTVLARYHTILYQSRVFHFLPGQDAKPVKNRLMLLVNDVETAQDLRRRYDFSIVLKCVDARRDVTANELLELFGFNDDDGEGLAYFDGLLKEIKSRDRGADEPV